MKPFCFLSVAAMLQRLRQDYPDELANPVYLALEGSEEAKLVMKHCLGLLPVLDSKEVLPDASFEVMLGDLWTINRQLPEPLVCVPPASGLSREYAWIKSLYQIQFPHKSIRGTTNDGIQINAYVRHIPRGGVVYSIICPGGVAYHLVQGYAWEDGSAASWLRQATSVFNQLDGVAGMLQPVTIPYLTTSSQPVDWSVFDEAYVWNDMLFPDVKMQLGYTITNQQILVGSSVGGGESGTDVVSLLTSGDDQVLTIF